MIKTIKSKVEKVIAMEGLIIIAIAIALYIAMAFCKIVPVAYPKYKAQFSNTKEYVIVIYPDMNYKSAFDSGILLKNIYNPSEKLISRRIEEFKKQANISAKLVKAKCINSPQLRLSEAYSNILLVPFIFKIFFVYVFLFFVRFIIWAVKTIQR